MCSRGRAPHCEIIETYDQQRVDRLIQAVAWAVANRSSFHRLVGMGIEESGLGDFDSRMNKRMKIRGVLRDALRSPSVGVIEEDPEKGLVKYGKPVGVIGCIVPTTNPDLTPAGNAIYAIKARDVVVFSPHPRSQHTTFETVRLMREALEAEGAPADILQCITLPSLAASQEIMRRSDLVIATGGQGLVRAAYSSGTPGVRRRRRQCDGVSGRDRRHCGDSAQLHAVEDVGFRLRLLGGRKRARSVEPLSGDDRGASGRGRLPRDLR